MRTQIAAGNWKMNLTYEEGKMLLDTVLGSAISPKDHQRVVFAVPFPYLVMARDKAAGYRNFLVSAQNCSDKKNGAFTGEVSAEMLHSIGIPYCVLGHSERREYFSEENHILALKINLCLEYGITPIYCCGEPLSVREVDAQEGYVEAQIKEALFHLSEERIREIVIAYEPIWAIGTGKTATAGQAQEMHAHIRKVLHAKFGKRVAENVSILYGGSVKAGNAKELFDCPDVDGGLVGGASLVAADFVQIIRSLK